MEQYTKEGPYERERGSEVPLISLAYEEQSYAGHARDSSLHQLNSRPASRLGGPSESHTGAQ